MSLGNFLKKVRLEKGIKSKDLAIAIGMHPSNYCRLEADKIEYKPSYALIKKIRECLALSSTEWFELLSISKRLGDYVNEIFTHRDKVIDLLDHFIDLDRLYHPSSTDLLLEVYRIKRSIAGGKSFPWHATLHYECERILQELNEKTFSIASSINQTRAEKISDLLNRLSAIRRSLNLPEIEDLEVING